MHKFRKLNNLSSPVIILLGVKAIMNKQAVIWLYRQLPELVDKGILPPEYADRLREYYGPVEENRQLK